MKTIKHATLTLLLGAGFMAATGCTHTSDMDESSSRSSDALMVVGQTNSPNADNSSNNIQDRAGNTLTAGDQGSSPEDRDLTQKIRQSLVSDSNYSLTAKNIKIITVNGRVTLRGPVNSDAEKSGVEALAKNIAGEGNVDDQLEVKLNQ